MVHLLDGLPSGVTCAMSATSPCSTPPEPHRFSVRLPRPLWIGLAAVVLILGGVALQFGLQIDRQQTAIREIERLGGVVESEPRGPEWLWEWLDDEWMEAFYTITDVHLTDTPATDATLQQLRGLAGLRGLHLGGTRVTDDELAYLKDLHQLERLSLDETQITDAGLKHLQRLTNLKFLNVASTGVTDAGISELKWALPKLTVSKVPPGML
jgi:hypothetical protein